MAKSIGYLAVDLGAKLTLQSLADRLPGKWLTREADNFPDWNNVLRTQGTELLICGTSDTEAGRALEAAARIAANAVGVRCVIIEDFPGNYAEVAGGRPGALFVDSEFAARLARGKSGQDLVVNLCPAVRYDALRRQIDLLRNASESTANRAVLWIGQPETEDSLKTLRCLLPALQAYAAQLWIRAHPRDEGYARGAYAEFLHRSGGSVKDLTAAALDDCLQMRPTLVATQFSSVAVEAGFWGIPAINVLLPDAGAARLAAKKGYSVPPWCEAGAAFLITRHEDVEKGLGKALMSGQARAQALRCFDRYFRVHEDGSRRLINVLYNQRFL